MDITFFYIHDIYREFYKRKIKFKGDTDWNIFNIFCHFFVNCIIFY